MIPVILTQRNTATVNVKGSINDDSGKPVPFHFKLLCKRLSAKALQAELEDKTRPLTEFMAMVAEGWKGVKDGDGQDLPFSPEALDELLDIPGVARIAFNAYLEEQAAKEKN